jgi:hypothetical protein
MEKEELLRLAYIKLAKAAEMLQMAGDEPLAEEAEALADKVDRAATAAGRPSGAGSSPVVGREQVVPHRHNCIGGLFQNPRTDPALSSTRCRCGSGRRCSGNHWAETQP